MNVQRWPCPNCGEPIPVIARICRFCGNPPRFNPAVRQGSVEAAVILERWRERAEQIAAENLNPPSSERPTPQAASLGTEAPATPPATEAGSVDAKSASSRLPDTLASDLATELLRLKPRAKYQAALVDYMADRASAPYAEVADKVQGDETTSGDAIEKLVVRTNETLAELQSPVRYRCASERVIKEISAE